MNKAELIKALAEKSGITQEAAGKALDALSSIFTAELAAGHEVSIQGVGKIKVTQVAGRTGRNPRTGETVAIPPSLKANLVASSDLKKVLNG